MNSKFNRLSSIILAICMIIPLFSAVFFVGAAATTETVVTNQRYQHVVAHNYKGSNYDYDADTFSYYDSYFSNSSYQFNYDIAQFAFALAFAGLGTSQYGKSETKNLEDMFSTINCSNLEEEWETQDINTIGSYIASKDATVNGKEYKIVFVVIRGGGYKTEWAGNFNVGESGEHHGFAIAAEKVKTRLTEYIADYCAGKNLKILVCGYSRAGATTNLLAKRLDEAALNGTISSGKIVPEDIYAYGFEVPMGAVNDVTTKYKGYTLTDNIFSMVNGSDFVTKVAPAAYGFQRYGRTIYVTSDNKSEMLNNFAEYFGSKNPNGRKDVTYSIKDNQDAALEGLFARLTSVFKTRKDYVDRLQPLIMDIMKGGYSDGGIEVLVEIYGTYTSADLSIKVSDDLTNFEMDFGWFLEEKSDLLKLYHFLKGDWSIRHIIIQAGHNGSGILIKEDECSAILDCIDYFIYSICGKQATDSYRETIKNCNLRNAKEKITNVFNEISQCLGSAIAQGHYPELCAAWLKASKFSLIGEMASDFEIDNPYTITLTHGTGGTVTGSGNSNAGEYKIVTAIPNDGYEFEGWYSANESKKLNLPNPYWYYVDSDLSMKAKFVKVSAETRDPYFDLCDELPGGGKIKVSANTTTMKSLPCSNETKPNDDVMTLYKGNILTYSRVYRNSAGNYWFYATYEGKSGFVYYGDIVPQDSTIQLSFEKGRYPDSSFSRNSFFFPGGTVFTQGEDIRQVAIALYNVDTNKIVNTWTENVNSDSITTSYSFEKQFSKVDYVTRAIKNLPNGNYKLYYIVRLKTISSALSIALGLKSMEAGSRSFSVVDPVNPSVMAAVALTSQTVNSSYVKVGAKETVIGGVANDTDRIGIRIYDTDGNLLKHYKELPAVLSDSTKTRNMTYTIGKGKEVNLALKQNKTYKYEIYVIVKGHEFRSVSGTFTTSSSAQQETMTPVVTPDTPKSGGYTVFSQKDPRWGSIKYGKTDQASTIAAAGCCPLSIVNGIYYLTGIFVEPTLVCDFAVANGCRGDSGGTSSSLYKLFLNQLGSDYGVKLDKSMTFSDNAWDEIISALSSSKVVFIKNSHHYMVLADYDTKNDLFLLLDSSGWKERKTLDTGYAWLTRNELRGKDGWCDGHGVVGYSCWIMSATDSEVNQFTGSQNTDVAGYYYVASDGLAVKKTPSLDASTVATLSRGSIVHVTMAGENTAGEPWYKIENGFVRFVAQETGSNLVPISEGYIFEKKSITSVNSSYSSKDYVCCYVHPFGANTLGETTSFGCIIYTKLGEEFFEAARAVDNKSLSGTMFYNVSQSPKAANTKFYDSSGSIYRFTPGQTYYYRMFVNYTHNGIERTAYSFDYANGNEYYSFTAESANAISAEFTNLIVNNVTALSAEISYHCQIANGVLNGNVSKIGVLLYNEEGVLITEAYLNSSPNLSGKNDFFYNNNIPISDLQPDTSYMAQVYAVISGVTMHSDYISFTTMHPTDLDYFKSTAEDAAGFYYVSADIVPMYSVPNSNGTPISMKVNGNTISSISKNYIVYADQIGVNSEGKSFFHLQKRNIGFICDQIGDVYVESEKLSPMVSGTYQVVPFSSSSTHLTLWENDNLTGNNGDLYRGTQFSFTGEIKDDLGTASYNGKSGWIKIGYSMFVTPAVVSISYDANGGSNSPETQTEEYGITARISNMIPNRDGFDFIGWSENSGAAVADYKANDDFPAERSVTLYAVWGTHTHVFGNWIHAVDATCSESEIETRVCSICGASENRTIGNPLGHLYECTVYDANCIVPGYTKHTCVRCGDSYEDEFTELGTHTEGEWMESIAPTCLSEGEEIQECTVCGVKLQSRTIEATGHTWNSGVVTKEPTCTADGVKTFTCTTCGETITKPISATGHTPGEWEITKEAQCTENGTKVRHCTVCGDIVSEDIIPATGHQYGEWTITIHPSETTSGEKERTCSVCGHKETQAIDPAGVVPTITIDDIKAHLDEEITVDVDIADNPGIISMSLKIGYDNDVLELLSASAVDFAGLSFGPTTANPFVVTWEDVLSGNNNTNGTFVRLIFKVKKTTTADTTQITISYDDDNVFNEDFDNVFFDIQVGEIEIVHYLPGDVNRDGVVNMKDYAILKQYINGWDVDIELSVADVTGDGNINMKDYALLKQFINGWDVVLK